MSQPECAFSLPRQSEQNDAGFTLIEVLVALALLSTIGVLMSQYLVQLKQIDRQTERAKWQMLAKAEARYIGTTLSQALVVPYEYEQGGVPVVFSGSASKVVFVAPVRITSARFGVRRIRLVIGSDQTKAGMELATVTADKIENSAPLIVEQFNASNSRFEVQYLNDSNEWTDQWTTTSELPVAFSIKAIGPNAIQSSIAQTFLFQNRQPSQP